MKNKIVELFNEERCAKWLALGMIFIWVAALFSTISVATPLVVASSFTAALFIIIGVIAACIQHP
jgi:hypothetical protein